MCCGPAGHAIRPSFTSRSAAGCRPRMRCSRSADFSMRRNECSALNVLARFFVSPRGGLGVALPVLAWPAEAAVSDDDIDPAAFEGPVVAFFVGGAAARAVHAAPRTVVTGPRRDAAEQWCGSERNQNQKGFFHSGLRFERRPRIE